MLPDAVAREIIADHQRRPRHTGPLDGVGGVTLDNPGCGDQVTVWADVRGGRIVALTFTGKGCAISQSSASLMTVALTGKTVKEARALAARYRAMIMGETPVEEPLGSPDLDSPHLDSPALGDLLALSGVSRLHARRKCALLAWQALEQALGTSTPG
ncbi:Fe-S cluster assembly sulfur transfer protein SufU [Deinococcus sp.]|uniref:Fe-S cluster assembly sulfur transfer protein SufU n=1 Tax=Deinococcus sp. TaxID=47478 RepID=UPI0025BB5D5E|nr:SUF system NifU family Fe-S cluster assembly protein [Deinococcus sp.]